MSTLGFYREYKLLRVLHVIPGIAARYGGPSTVISQMVAALNELPGIRAEIATTDADGPKRRISAHDFASLPVHLFPRTCSESWKFSLGLRSWLVQHVSRYDVVHIHAVWAHSTVVASKVARKHGIPFIIRPAGMFSHWSLDHRRWKKYLAWNAFHRRYVKYANVFHATAEQEAVDIRKMKLTNPVAVVPNGVNLPDTRPQVGIKASRKRVLFLGRIHPVKGLVNLLRAWHRAEPSCEWELVLAGPDEGGHRAELETLVQQLHLTNCVRFAGPVKAEDKWHWYYNCHIFVLPSFTENFSVSVAEALMAELPVITTTGTPWSKLRDLQCGWYVEPSEDALLIALREALRMTDFELTKMGKRGAAWARERFSWSAVANDLLRLYTWIRNGGDAPNYVMFK